MSCVSPVSFTVTRKRLAFGRRGSQYNTGCEGRPLYPRLCQWIKKVKMAPVLFFGVFGAAKIDNAGLSTKLRRDRVGESGVYTHAVV